MIRTPASLIGLLLLSAPALASAADCLVEAASFARAESRPLRLVLLPPRVQIIGEVSPGATPRVAPAPVLAETLIPEVHCGLEALGYEVDALSLAGPPRLRRREVTDRDVDWAWQSLRRLTRKACDADVELESGDGVPEAVPIASAIKTEGLVFVQALTLVRGKGFRTFVRAIETVAPDINFPGATDDLTWVEIAIVDGRTGELLVLAAEVIERRLVRNPRAIAVEAVDRAVAVIPRRDEPTAWGLELEQANLEHLEVPPRCLLSASSTRRNFERLLQEAAGSRRIDGEADEE